MQIVSSIETLKDALTVFGIKETLVILSSADGVSNINNPILLLASIRNDVDDFLRQSNVINDDTWRSRFQENVIQTYGEVI